MIYSFQLITIFLTKNFIINPYKITLHILFHPILFKINFYKCKYIIFLLFFKQISRENDNFNTLFPEELNSHFFNFFIYYLYYFFSFINKNYLN